MAITTTGGSGTTTPAALNGIDSFTLLTTPNTANAIFIVDWSLSIPTIHTTASAMKWFVNGQKVPYVDSVYAPTDPFYYKIGGTVRVGPNTAVLISSRSSGSITTAVFAYNWVGIVVT